MNIVLDSNVILQVAFTQKPLRIVWDKLLEDTHFNVLKENFYPKVDVVSLEEFIAILKQ